MEQSNKERIDQLTRKLDFGKMAPPPKRTERPVPRVYRHLIKFEHFRQFPLIERIKILFGCNLVTMVGIACPHNPGETQPLVVQHVSRQPTATDHMKTVVEQMMEAQADKSNVEHEPKDKVSPG